MMARVRVAIVGLGMAGSTLARLLADRTSPWSAWQLPELP